ncbi:5-formyltetrahydrofolate cyclo-ligase [Streptococcus caprae]|uniref:5-formyltetrahydrofolate cyclo-ligase n=1 Tax=Streptococcus caprae TaxID=1640501 RepID=A0ABV8CTR0_9STRE
MKKIDIRHEMLSLLKSQSQTEKEQADNRFLEKLVASPAYQSAKTIATYLSFPHEFATSALITQALADGKQVCVPKTFKGGRMIFVAYDPHDLVETSFGLLEPGSSVEVDKATIDLIHVPGLAFNKDGFRLGYGAGFYDRYLADYEGQTLSTLYSFQRAEFEPDDYDIAVKELLIDEK